LYHLLFDETKFSLIVDHRQADEHQHNRKSDSQGQSGPEAVSPIVNGRSEIRKHALPWLVANVHRAQDWSTGFSRF
jgi:hypothetical protein